MKIEPRVIIVVMLILITCLVCFYALFTQNEQTEEQPIVWNASTVVDICIIENETVYILENHCIVYFGDADLIENNTIYQIGDMIAYPESCVLGVVH